MSCIFCKIAAGEIKAPIVHQDKDIVAFDDLAPQAPVHVVIIPREHITEVAELNDYPSKILKAAPGIARSKGIEEGGYRLVMNKGKNAGQAVDHIHFHLLGGRAMKWPPG